MSNVRWVAVAHGTLAAFGAVAVVAPLLPVEESPLLRLDDRDLIVFLGAASLALIVGLIEGLLLRLPNREVGQGLGMLLAIIAAVPVYAAMMFAYAPWWPDEDQQVPIGNLVTALVCWLTFVVCLSVAALTSAPRCRDSTRVTKGG